MFERQKPPAGPGEERGGEVWGNFLPPFLSHWFLATSWLDSQFTGKEEAPSITGLCCSYYCFVWSVSSVHSIRLSFCPDSGVVIG